MTFVVSVFLRTSCSCINVFTQSEQDIESLSHFTGMGLRYREKLWLVFTAFLQEAMVNTRFLIAHTNNRLDSI